MPDAAQDQEETMTRVFVRLNSVHCRKTEDIGPLGSKDEFYVTGAVLGGTVRNSVVTIPMSIDNGDTLNFPHPVIFDGQIEAGHPVRIALTAYDEDAGKDWTSMQALGDVAQTVLDEKMKEHKPDGSITGISDPSNDEARKVMNIVFDALQALSTMDEDDRLGTLAVDIPVKDPDPYHERAFSWNFWGDGSDYTLSYSVCETKDGHDPVEARAVWLKKRADDLRRAGF
jgi:hypothetical protein